MKLPKLLIAVILAGCGAEAQTGEQQSTAKAETSDKASNRYAGPRAEVPDGFPADVYLHERLTVQIAQRVKGGFSLIGATGDSRAQVLVDIRREMAARDWEELPSDAQAQLMGAIRFTRNGRLTSYTVAETKGATSVRIDAQVPAE